jgi:hypothetical protein
MESNANLGNNYNNKRLLDFDCCLKMGRFGFKGKGWNLKVNRY